MHHPETMQGNIRKLYAMRAVDGAMFSIPIIILFYTENGLSLRDAFLIQSAYSLFLVLWEVPSGYLSDRWGRRNVLIIGTGLNFLSFIVYASGTGFTGFLAAELLLAVGMSFLSGTIEALTYDTLSQMEETSRYRAAA